MKRKYDAISSDTPLMNPNQTRIELRALGKGLTKVERELESLLLEVAADINATRRDGERIVVRWAGGWVRDKLLGIQSHDIDVAISLMTGEAFARHLVEFCQREDVQKKFVGTGRLYTVASNPDKSKHLETTTTKLFGLDVDFVNLRKETYAEDSRNPQMEFGTAAEDALRRDATINALFYNIHTEEVEDFVGGVEDMRKKLIRTPLEPLQTFKDDPLRVLRLVRFASRLEFTLDPKAAEVMSDKSVLEALRVKISRERVGIELGKMLEPSKHPHEALKMIDKLDLYHTIFTDPARQDMPQPDVSSWHVVYDTLESLTRGDGLRSLYKTLVRDKEDTKDAWYLASLTPWELLPVDPPLPSGKLAMPLATQVAREGFKAPNKVSEILTTAHRNREDIVRLKKVVDLKQDDMSRRDVFGMAIRKWDSPKAPWRLQVLSAVFVDVFKAATGEDGRKRDEVLDEWEEFVNHLKKLDVLEAPSIQRLVNGKELAKALGAKPGNWMTRAMDMVMEWQLRNPGSTDRDAAVEEIKQRKQELGLG